MAWISLSISSMRDVIRKSKLVGCLKFWCKIDNDFMIEFGGQSASKSKLERLFH